MAAAARDPLPRRYSPPYWITFLKSRVNILTKWLCLYGTSSKRVSPSQQSAEHYGRQAGPERALDEWPKNRMRTYAIFIYTIYLPFVPITRYVDESGCDNTIGFRRMGWSPHSIS